MTKMMEYYKNLVEFLGTVLADNCEIALQDLSKDKQCIVAIANSHVSGRKAGSPVTDLALKFVESGIWKEKNYVSNYVGKTANNKVLNSSTYFIKENGKLLGMLCINIDNSKYIDMGNALLKMGGADIYNVNPMPEKIQISPDTSTGQETENFFEKPEDLINSMLTDYFIKNNIPADRLTQDEKIEIIKKLDGIGIFRLKGAISSIAGKLTISEASVYRYLSKLKKGKNNENI